MDKNEIEAALEAEDSSSKWGLDLYPGSPVSDNHPNLVVLESRRWVEGRESGSLRYIIHDTSTDKYWQLFSSYDSHNGEDFYGNFNVTEVKPVTKTVTVYE